MPYAVFFMNVCKYIQYTCKQMHCCMYHTLPVVCIRAYNIHGTNTRLYTLSKSYSTYTIYPSGTRVGHILGPIQHGTSDCQ